MYAHSYVYIGIHTRMKSFRFVKSIFIFSRYRSRRYAAILSIPRRASGLLFRGQKSTSTRPPSASLPRFSDPHIPSLSLSLPFLFFPSSSSSFSSSSSSSFFLSCLPYPSTFIVHRVPHACTRATPQFLRPYNSICIVHPIADRPERRRRLIGIIDSFNHVRQGKKEKPLVRSSANEFFNARKSHCLPQMHRDLTERKTEIYDKFLLSFIFNQSAK